MQELELLNIGLLAGIMSGFFGIGGGTVTVPLLVAIGFDIRHAIGISAFQMIFTSIYGSYLNHKKAVFDMHSNMPFLIGGAVGGAVGGYFMGKSSPFWLGILMLFFVIATTVKLFISNPSPKGNKVESSYLYALIGMVIGTLGGMVGIGGALMLTPILIGYLNFSIKEAIGVSLFFVISSSIFAFLAIYLTGFAKIDRAIYVALPSLIGVAFGVHIAHKTSPYRHKTLLMLLYILIIVILANKIFFT